MIGTPLYMSPELMDIYKNGIDDMSSISLEKSDLYSLSLVIL